MVLSDLQVEMLSTLTRCPRARTGTRICSPGQSPRNRGEWADFDVEVQAKALVMGPGTAARCPPSAPRGTKEATQPGRAAPWDSRFERGLEWGPFEDRTRESPQRRLMPPGQTRSEHHAAACRELDGLCPNVLTRSTAARSTALAGPQSRGPAKVTRSVVAQGALPLASEANAATAAVTAIEHT